MLLFSLSTAVCVSIQFHWIEYSVQSIQLSVPKQDVCDSVSQVTFCLAKHLCLRSSWEWTHRVRLALISVTPWARELFWVIIV